MAESTRPDTDKPKTHDHGHERIALVLGGGAPTLTLQAGALLALDEEGVEFDVISTSGAGMLIGLLYAAPKGKSRRQALEATVELGVHDAIYNLFPINYKVFCKPGPLASMYYKATMPFIEAMPKGTDLQRLWKDWAHLWVSAFSPTEMTSKSIGMCEAAPWLEDVIDFAALKNFGPEFYINAWNIREKRMRVFNKRELSPAHFRAALAFPLIYPPFELDGDHYIEGSAMDTLNLGGLLRYDQVFDNEYLAALARTLEEVRASAEQAISRGDHTTVKRLANSAKKRARAQALGHLTREKGKRRQSAMQGESPESPPSAGARVDLAKLRRIPQFAAVLDEQKAVADSELNTIDRIVAFDVLGTEALVRRPRNLYDAWVLQMIVPLVSLAHQEIAEFREDYEAWVKNEEDRILHLLHFEKQVAHDHWDRVLDWSYSNLSLLFKAGYRAGKEFYAEKKWLHGHKGAPAAPS